MTGKRSFLEQSDEEERDLVGLVSGVAMRGSGELIASFRFFFKISSPKAHIVSEAKAMHKALSANLHNAKASAQCKCTLDIAHQMADSVDESPSLILLQLRKVKSTAGRGDPSASISAAIALGGRVLSLIVERQDYGSSPSQETLHVRVG
jgi:hypothetical protein